MIGIEDCQMPDICQDCPCFNLVRLEKFWVKLCRVRGKTLGTRTESEDTPIEWYETKRPEWCPLVDISGITIEGTCVRGSPKL